MSGLALEPLEHRERLGLKGPRAAQWLAANGVDLPMTPNTWTIPAGASAAAALLVARLGAAELDRKSTRLNSSHLKLSRMPSSA